MHSLILSPNKNCNIFPAEFVPTCVSSAQAPDRLASVKRHESLTPCGDTKNAAGLRFPLHFSSSPLLSASQTAELGTSHASRASGFPPLGESSAAERQPCLPLPPAAAGLPSPSAAPPLPIKAGALMGTLVSTIYIHYALRKAPCLKQILLGNLIALSIRE